MKEQIPLQTQRITEKRVLQVLTLGFSLVTVMLVAVGFIGVKNIRSIRESAANLVEDQLVTSRLIGRMHASQSTIRLLLLRILRDPESVDPEEILSHLDESEQEIGLIVAAAPQGPEGRRWAALWDAILAFTGEARRLLSDESRGLQLSRELFERQDQVVAAVRALVAASQEKAAMTKEQIEGHADELVRKSLWLLGACLLLGPLCSVLTVRVATGLFRKMEWQTAELSRVSWQMLEKQEITARRFSHELHDELGQSLTALKANLVAVESSSEPPASRLRDCLQLVDEAIRNTRELSQLLHPTVLDDFGLDAALRWLCERFQQRSGIEVNYNSNFRGRLPDESETHLFRIAQEALTNVARHSEAKRVKIRLKANSGEVRLTIADDGRGMVSSSNGQSAGLGLVGMRARAREAGGELTVRSAPNQGTLIEVLAPAIGSRNAESDTNSAG